ncbi:unnamed protein product [Trifolium pratense]|uniref:Uncharacterized protein n=2 Tax=Trifolium pratense TaxID=57577 RepID=A0ACB0L1Z9_TRIPR|nr:unnamed protein product [Trifolium pratense]CAJ2663412.1 unnamed protein product [Trifolium pratense]
MVCCLEMNLSLTVKLTPTKDGTLNVMDQWKGINLEKSETMYVMSKRLYMLD